MVVVVFRARIFPEKKDEYYQKVEQMAALARKMPGFISFKGYLSEDGERVSIHEWESPALLKAWRDHPEHKKIQQYGREHFYHSYSLYVCEQPRESHFSAE